jgi:hypothetical protein
MSVVEGVSFAHTGTFATSFTTSVTTEMSSWSLPMFDPYPCGPCAARKVQFERVRAFGLQAFASVCQFASS